MKKNRKIKENRGKATLWRRHLFRSRPIFVKRSFWGVWSSHLSRQCLYRGFHADSHNTILGEMRRRAVRLNVVSLCFFQQHLKQLESSGCKCQRSSFPLQCWDISGEHCVLSQIILLGHIMAVITFKHKRYTRHQPALRRGIHHVTQRRVTGRRWVLFQRNPRKSQSQCAVMDKPRITQLCRFGDHVAHQCFSFSRE